MLSLTAASDIVPKVAPKVVIDFPVVRKRKFPNPAPSCEITELTLGELCKLRSVSVVKSVMETILAVYKTQLIGIFKSSNVIKTPCINPISPVDGVVPSL